MKKLDSNSNLKEEHKDNKETKELEKSNVDSKNNSKINNSDINNTVNNEDSNINEKKLKDDEIMVEVVDRGVNTDELDLSELDRLVKDNKELQEILNDDKGNKLNEDIIINVEHNTSEISSAKKNLIEELTKNDGIKESLTKTNNELNNKIILSEKKYQEIINKINEKKGEDIEKKLELQIKELEKEIKANNSETERYKKLIENLKDQIEFKENIERASNIQRLLKQETLRNIELKEKLNTLNKINKYQSKYMENYKKKHKIEEKEEQLKKEIAQNKSMIKDYNNKYLKLDRFTKAAHAKIMGVRIYIGKIINEPKIVEKKIFTNEETKDTLDVVTNLKAQINQKRKVIDEIQKDSESKIHELLVRNKQIEMDFAENKRIYKNLLCKKNEINKKLKDINKKNNNKKIIIKSNDNVNIKEEKK